MRRTLFVCSECAHESAKWHGRCQGCGEWNSLVEEVAPLPVAQRAGGRRAGSMPRSAHGIGSSAPFVPAGGGPRPVRLAAVEAPAVPRISTGVGELDLVLGGGLVPGSLVLIGGSPGIGKSTLTGSALANVVASGRSALYVSGEESAAQVRLRAERLGPAALEVPFVAETDLESVVTTIEREAPDVCVVDSVQTLYADELSGAPGSVGQVRESAGRLLRVAKERGVAMLLVGHVTKEGALAGPRVLEHVVDCVLQFEGEHGRSYRTLRALKNRFGSTNEVGVFEMREQGLVEVADASARFVAEATRAPGSAVVCAMEGSRPLLVEVQALVAPTELVPPRRVANGVERNRLALVLAVLARHAGLSLGSSDVFVSVAGGVSVEEPGADLGVALAVASAARGVPLGWPDPSADGDGVPAEGARRLGEPYAGPRGGPAAAFGEVGLTGELRQVAHPDRRRAEAAKFGLEPVLGPGEGARTLRDALRMAIPERLSARAA